MKVIIPVCVLSGKNPVHLSSNIFKQMTDVQPSITVCACASRTVINRTELIRLVSALKNAGYTVRIVPDLCQTAISDAERMTVIASASVVACYPRAILSIFDSHGLKPEHNFDLRNQSCEQILNESGISLPVFSPEHAFPEFPPDEKPEAWYPVIDRERCTTCGKCFDFCLFGVYSVDKKGTVKVTQPQKCKTNCPACARVCPAKAIIFPKYEKSPVNGGLHDEEQFTETDIKALSNIALKQKLAERRSTVPLLKKDKP